MLVRMWRKGNPDTLLVGRQITTVIMESSMEIPQKKTLKIELPYDPAYPIKTVQVLKITKKFN